MVVIARPGARWCQYSILFELLTAGLTIPLVLHRGELEEAGVKGLVVIFWEDLLPSFLHLALELMLCIVCDIGAGGGNTWRIIMACCRSLSMLSYFHNISAR